MKKVVITSYCRTPIGAYLGDLKTVPVQDLATLVIKEAIQRSSLTPEQVEEVVMGHVMATPEAGNFGRRVALQAGCPITTTGFTVNRICGSGLQAVISAAQEIQTGLFDIVVAGGAESLSRVPYYLPLSVRYEGLKNGNKQLLCTNEEYMKHCAPEDIYPVESMGQTAENIVAEQGITREEQDIFAYNSQMRAKQAVESGRFAMEIVPVSVKTRKGTVMVSLDGHPRPETTLEGLAKLRPCFKKDGSVTAGNSSGMNDAAAALVMMSEDKCKDLGLKPLAYVADYAMGGVDPRVMGYGPVPSINKVLAKNNLTLEDIDFVEINEAFAGQVLGCMKKFGCYLDSPLYQRLNIHGGAVALGHPLGMTGARLVGTMCTELSLQKQAKYAIASACIGGGQGLAILLTQPEAQFKTQLQTHSQQKQHLI